MILIIPVVNQKGLTKQIVQSLEDTVEDKGHFHIVIVDNDSDPVYTLIDFTDNVKEAKENKLLKKGEIHITVIRNDFNVGHYYPLKQVYDLYHNLYPQEVIATVHNDVIFYEKGWDVRVNEEFLHDPYLGLLGFVGSNQADYVGGRGVGTVGNLAGIQGSPMEQHGKRITNLQPSVLLDSLFMAFRTTVIPSLGINEHITPYHFYDKIWSCKTIEAGYRVATLGISIDHLGGKTGLGEEKCWDDSKQWLEKEGLYDPNEDPLMTIYKVAEKRWLSEYRDQKGFIPCCVDQNYKIWTWLMQDNGISLFEYHKCNKSRPSHVLPLPVSEVLPQ